LKLAPRSKPVSGEGPSASSNIFGGAKARDQQAWEKSRQQDQPKATAFVPALIRKKYAAKVTADREQYEKESVKRL